MTVPLYPVRCDQSLCAGCHGVRAFIAVLPLSGADSEDKKSGAARCVGGFQ